MIERIKLALMILMCRDVDVIVVNRDRKGRFQKIPSGWK